MVQTIKQLPTEVVNKIAAGEIITSPSNALKELLENSIDAKATTIDILLKDSGIQLLQITDNGDGISKDDLPILCRRFTTSKLKTFEDLNEIQTYGFRGEALSSISHIARVSVITKTKGDKCAWKAEYLNGELINDPVPSAGKDGTVIMVKDLFYNVPGKLRTMKNLNEELSKIIEVSGRYGIHSKNIGVSVKKVGSPTYALNIRNTLNLKDRIRVVQGQNIASNLLSINYQNEETENDTESLKHDKIGIQVIEGEVSTLNYVSKKATSPIFFINHRLVTCDPLRRALNQVYSTFLPKGNKHFIYLSIVINPENVDVNVHPTKREVRFLYQDDIIEKITNLVSAELSKIDTVRTFTTTNLDNMTNNSYVENTKVNYIQPQLASTSQLATSSAIQKPKRYENKLVRTDASQTRITSFLKNSAFQPSRTSTVLNDNSTTVIDSNPSSSTCSVNVMGEPEQTLENDETLPLNNEIQYTVMNKERVNVNLSSVKRLREKVDLETHHELTNIFANLTYVGIVDYERRLAAIQYDLKLFLVDYAAIANELFYQIGLTDFANFGRIELQQKIFLKETLDIFDEISESDKINSVQNIWNMKDMLNEYFAIEIDSDTDTFEYDKIFIKSLPLLLKNYIPAISKLPFLIYRLGTKINWDEEEECLDGILKQIALFYVPEILEIKDPENQDISEEEHIKFIADTESMSSTLEDTFFPCVKRRFLAPASLMKDVIEIANLPGLYKIFERC